MPIEALQFSELFVSFVPFVLSLDGTSPSPHFDAGAP